MRFTPHIVKVLSLAAIASLAVHVHVAAAKGPDFDGDGFADLAVGDPFEDIDGAFSAGSVSVIYGSNSGLASAGDQVWHLNKPGMPIPVGQNAGFGGTLAWGDFNGDGRDDLAIAASSYELLDKDFAGIVVVLYGSGSGLKVQGSQLWHQDSSTDMLGESEENDDFGFTLGAGDFNHDGRDDLAIGVLGELNFGGAVAVIYGSSSGLTATGNQLLHQDLTGFEGDVEPNDQFGSALAVGDFNNDNRNDLAVGVRNDNPNGIDNAGAVHIIYGSNAGLKVAGNKVFHQDSPGIADPAEPNDIFGRALCSGDFDGDGRDDLAVGSNETLIVNGEGAVHVLYGSSSGLKASGSQFWHQDKSGIADHTEPFEAFGRELIAGDFNDDGRDDLAINVEETINGAEYAGAVHVLYGSSSGLKSNGSQFWHQNKSGVNGSCQTEDFYGDALAVGDFDDDGRDDLAIGVPGEDIAIPDDAVITGIVVHLFGLSHTFPADMDIMLESPTGQKVMLMSDVGGSQDINNITLSIHDANPSMPPFGTPITTGSYSPTDHQPGDVLPGVSGPYSVPLSSLNGLSPIGEWKLFINDDVPGNGDGSLSSWRILISTIAVRENDQQITIGATTSPYPSTITINKIPDAGAVNVLYGTSSGLTSDGDQSWHRNQPSINGKCKMLDSFGNALSR